jgi:heme-degrading monooxygenase HmoA
MIVRIWRTEIESSRAGEYEAFAREQSLPMFREQPGFLGVLFLGTGARQAVVTLWKDEGSLERLNGSPTYEATVSRLVKTGVLRGQQSLEVLEERGGLPRVWDLLQTFAGASGTGGSDEAHARRPDDDPD